MHRFLRWLCIWLFLLVPFANLNSITWIKTYGGEKSDLADSVQQTADSGYIPSRNTVTFSHSYSDAEKYTIRVVAMDNTIDSLLSDTVEYSVRIKIPPNNPPEKPVYVSGPGIGYINILYPFSTKAKDPDNDSIAYRFDWNDGDTSNWSDYVPSGTEVTIYHSYSDSGYYSIRSQAKDIYGLESKWSDGKGIVIEIGNHPPYTPDTILGPVRGVVGDTYTFSTYTTDPDTDRIKYIINCRDGSLDSSYLVSSGDTVFFAHSYSIEGKYDIIAMAMDEHRAQSDWSPPHNIVISKLGMKEKEIEKPELVYTLSASPNPSSKTVIVKFSCLEKKKLNLSLYSVLGQKVEELFWGRVYETKTIRLDVTQLSPGVYFLKLEGGNKIVTRKILILP